MHWSLLHSTLLMRGKPALYADLNGSQGTSILTSMRASTWPAFLPSGVRMHAQEHNFSSVAVTGLHKQAPRQALAHSQAGQGRKLEEQKQEESWVEIESSLGERKQETQVRGDKQQNEIAHCLPQKTNGQLLSEQATLQVIHPPSPFYRRPWCCTMMLYGWYALAMTPHSPVTGKIRKALMLPEHCGQNTGELSTLF